MNYGRNGSEEGHKKESCRNISNIKSEPRLTILESLIKNELGWLAVASSKMRGNRKIISKKRV